MLTLITATPGSGKTLYIVGKICDWIEQEEPRLIYQNIDGLKVDSPLIRDAPDDWRVVPDGSIVIYDECQKLFPATGKAGRVDDEMLTDLEEHRHRGIDIFFITQHPTFVHHHIRKLCGEHIHFYRAHGAKASAKYTWSHVCGEPNDRGEQRRANFELFRFNKKLYGLYKSTVLDTHKLRIPKKLWYFLAAILIMASFVAYSLRDGFNFSSGIDSVSPGVKAVERAQAPPPRPSSTSDGDDVTDFAPSWSSRPVFKPVSGCVHFEPRQKCSCYSSKGYVIDMSYAQCVSALSSPLPYRLFPSSSD